MKINAIFFGVLVTCSFLLSNLTPSPLLAQTSQAQRVDVAGLELELTKRIESLIEKLVGPGRAVVKVNFTIYERFKSGLAREDKAKAEETIQLRGMSGIAMLKSPARQADRSQRLTDLIRESPRIEKVYIKILVDENLEEGQVQLINETVPTWVGLDTARGDILEIQRVPWKKIQPLPIETLSAEQLKIGKRNVLVSVGIAAILGIVVIIIVVIAVTGIKTRRKGSGAEAGAQPEAAGMGAGGADRIVSSIDKLAKELGSLQPAAAAEGGGTGAGGRIDSLLEDIKEILSQPQAGAGAGGAAGGGAGGAASGGAGGSGDKEKEGGVGGEVVQETLKDIDDILKKQYMGENPLDRPFVFIESSLGGQEILKIAEGENEDVLLHILANINPEKAAEALSQLPEDKRLQIISKVGALNETSPEIVQSVREMLDKKLKEARIAGGATNLVGSEVLAKILSVSSDDIVHASLEKLREENPELAKETRKKLFLFEDIITLDNKAIGLILNNVDKDMLKLALKHAPEGVLEKIYVTMSERGAAMLKEDLEVMADVGQTQSREAQQAMLDIIRGLAKKGVVSITHA